MNYDEYFVDASEKKRCVEKVVLQKETEYDREVQCHHRQVGLKRTLIDLLDPDFSIITIFLEIFDDKILK